MKNIAGFLMVVWWVHGLVVAQGFWMTLVCVIPFASFFVSTAWFVEYFTKGCLG